MDYIWGVYVEGSEAPVRYISYWTDEDAARKEMDYLNSQGFKTKFDIEEIDINCSLSTLAGRY